MAKIKGSKVTKSETAPKSEKTEKTEKVAKNLKVGKGGKTETKTTKTSVAANYKRGTLGKAVYGYFDDCKAHKKDPVYEDCEKLAQKAMPGTKFNKLHYSWYKNKWNLKQ